MQDRREFLIQSSLAAAVAALLRGAPPRRLLIRAAAAPSFRRRLAERELLRGLTRVLPRADVPRISLMTTCFSRPSVSGIPRRIPSPPPMAP